jgi:hypothetical protein
MAQVSGRAAHRSPDPSQSPTVKAIRETRAKLTTITLRRLREQLFRLELSLLEQMVERGVNLELVAVAANTAKVLETIERLEAGRPGHPDLVMPLQRRGKRSVRALTERPRIRAPSVSLKTG